MRRKLILWVIVAIVMLLFATVVGGGFDKRSRDRDVIGYNVLAERIYLGTVDGEAASISGLMYFPMKTGTMTVEVQMGPPDFVQRSGFKIHLGESLTVIGMPKRVNERNLVFAREIRSTKDVLVLRNEVGVPLWDTHGPTFMDPERGDRVTEECLLVR